MLLALVLATQFSSVDAEVWHSLGIARDSQDQSLRYVEHHQYFESGQHQVRYYAPDGSVLMRKNIQYPGLPQHPDIHQIDLTRDTEIQMRTEDDKTSVEIQRKNKRQSRTVAVSADCIIDAGFDSYIRANWDQFIEAPEQQFQFLVAGQTRLIGMSIRRTSDGDQADEPATFLIKPRGWLVGLFVTETHLEYDQQRRLIGYRGMSNLKADEGQSKSVVIKFQHYGLDIGLERPLPEWLPKQLPHESADDLPTEQVIALE